MGGHLPPYGGKSAAAPAGQPPEDEQQEQPDDQRRHPLEHREARHLEQVDRLGLDRPAQRGGRRRRGSLRLRRAGGGRRDVGRGADRTSRVAGRTSASPEAPSASPEAGGAAAGSGDGAGVGDGVGSAAAAGAAAMPASPAASSVVRQSANRPSSLLPTSSITPRPNWAGFPVIARSVVTTTLVAVPPSSCICAVMVALAVPLPRASLACASITARRAVSSFSVNFAVPA